MMDYKYTKYIQDYVLAENGLKGAQRIGEHE